MNSMSIVSIVMQGCFSAIAIALTIKGLRFLFPKKEKKIETKEKEKEKEV